MFKQKAITNGINFESTNQQYGYPPRQSYGSQPPQLPPVEPPLPSQREPDRDGAKNFLSTVLILVAAPLIALFLTAFVFQSYEVDGPSMQNTLQDGDRLVVLKTAQTWAEITNNPHIPQRGEVIVFNLNEGGGNDRQLIKRVVGLPGDHVVVQGGVLTVYNSEHPGGFEPDKELPYGNMIKNTPGNVDITVPEGKVFVAGDNRENSQDSRYFGPIDSGSIVGELYLRLLPLSEARRF
jgi:signal peptidase I